MHLDTCKSCGGSLERIGNYYVCKFCGSKWTIDADQDVHVIDRANAWSALRDCDFERAGELFENIIYKEPENHEAYWGRALANAGIMYVTDFHENKKVPTCNSISESSFTESRDVKKAIELAPGDIAKSYRNQAEQIEAIRVEWVKKARREPAYDVFISYKDSDRENGIDRTGDSYDAHELYNALTAEGYKVFFSRVSLRSKVSEHYEPYIYNAIKTAKVMIVFGENPEYFNAVWIKNEWMRFRKRIELGEKHPNSLVVAYKGINPADLPVGLRSRQCLDASGFTFLEDLKSHIAKITKSEPKKAKAEPDVPVAEVVEVPKKKKWPIVAAVALVLAMAIGLAYLVPNINSIFGKSERTPEISSEIETGEESERITERETETTVTEATQATETTEATQATETTEATQATEATEATESTESTETPTETPTENPTESYSYDGVEYMVSPDGTYAEVINYTGSTTKVAIMNMYNGVPVTHIAPEAFRNSNITGIYIPEGITKIGDYAFYICESLTDVNIPNSVIDIGYYAFYACINLTDIENGVAYVDNWVVAFDNSYTSVTIRDGARGIADSAFAGSSKLRNITIPNSVTIIGDKAFSTCENLTNITISNNVTAIGNATFAFCSSLTNVTIPNSVTTIEDEAFGSCTNLISITIPDSVTNIGEGAFSNCLNLLEVERGVSYVDGWAIDVDSYGSVILRDGTRGIANSLFKNAKGIESATLPNSLTSIGSYAFYNCDHLTTIRYKGTEEQWYAILKGLNWDTNAGSYYVAFASTPGIKYNKSADGTYAEVVGYEGTAVDVIIANEYDGVPVTKISDSAFNGCSNILSILLPNSITDIGTYAFANCVSFIHIEIPQSVKYIDCYAFTNLYQPTIQYMGTSHQWNNIVKETDWNRGHTTLVISCSDQAIIEGGLE